MVRARDLCPYFRPSILTALFVLFFLGMLTVLFFRCIVALFNPVHRRGEGIKWGLVAYTVIMFSLVTVHTVMKDHILSISYIDNRDFPLNGPYGYADSIDSGAMSVIANTAFNLNNWLADGLLVGPYLMSWSLVCMLNVGPLALPLLHFLLHEPLGYCLSLPRLPRLCGYVPEVSTNTRHPGLTAAI